jgi:hypothetical protein
MDALQELDDRRLVFETLTAHKLTRPCSNWILWAGFSG